MTDLWTRLKQRKLVQWAVAYVAFAFALLQGVDIVAQQFGWPDSVQRSITLALVLGFFLVLLLAWYHGEQGRQKVSGTELLLIALVLGFGGAFMWWVSGSAGRTVHALAGKAVPARARTSAAQARVPVASTAPVPLKSVAVLPFVNEGGDKTEQFFSDGLSEDLITALSQFPGLKVINSDSSFKFRNSGDSVSAIARKLGVAHLLHGGVRRLGDEVRIRAELVNAADGSTLWSQHYDRPYKDLFKLQDDITRSVAEALKARLLDHAAQSDRPPSGSLDAYTAYLKGRAQPFTEAGLRRAIALFQQATRMDPEYASAYANESFAWGTLANIFLGGAESHAAIGHAREAVAAALRLAPDLPDARLAQVSLLLSADLDWQRALVQARRLVQLAPGTASNLTVLAQALMALGHPREAEHVARQAIAIDPLTAFRYDTLAWTLRVQGRLEEAAAAMHKAIELGPGDGLFHANLTLVRILQGDAAAALTAAKAEPPGVWHDFAMAAALQLGPDRKAATAALQRVIDRHADSSAYQIAQIYAIRRQPDRMFEWLDRAWANRDPGLFMLLTDPLILRYRDDPRFAAYCRKVGLPPPQAARPAGGEAHGG